MPIYNIVANIIKLPVVIKPNSANNQLMGILNGRLKIAIAAAPLDNKANQLLISFIADKLKLKKSQVIIYNGKTNGYKLLHLPVVCVNELNNLLSNL